MTEKIVADFQFPFGRLSLTFYRSCLRELSRVVEDKLENCKVLRLGTFQRGAADR